MVFITLGIPTTEPMKTKDWKPTRPAKALVIGHDPRLQESDTQAQYALFADFYFKEKEELNEPGDKAKYGLAKSTFDQILDITNGKIQPDEIYVTNLCNDSLPHAPKGKQVYIPRIKAEVGLANIRNILTNNPTIEYVFPMSLQVNYWLQKIGLYDSQTDFVTLSEPVEDGLNNDPPYFQPRRNRTFLLICGNVYLVKDGNQKIIPILHTKQYPLTKRTQAYGPAYERIRSYFS